MGSGLILLVIVAAWLAVLVPMALRSHDSSTSLSSVERFSDAMRVLSRRDAAARARASEVAGPERLGVVEDELDDEFDDAWDDAWDDDSPSHRALLMERVRPVVAGARARLRAGSPAARRRRLLAGLVLLALGTLVGAVVGPTVLLVVHLVADVALGLFVWQLRRLALRRAAQARPVRRQRRPLPATEVVARGSVRVRPRPAAGPPLVDEVPFVEPVVVGEPVVEQPAAWQPVAPRPAAEQPLFDQAAFADEPVDEPAVAEEPVEQTAAPSPGLGAPWTPVPVPAPVYASAPVAPSRRVAPEAPRSPEWTEPPTGDPREQDDVVQRRRAVNEW